MNFNNEQLPWYLIIGGALVLVIRLIWKILISYMTALDWLALIAIIIGTGLLVMGNSEGKPDNSA
ncbi:MAG: hypothetical protein CMG33_04300 [Candidatus Marinimicrobia bacterium]|nr:hypothetical protein [Candidatus Neomarinimicrobiota bacterium]|tara:strand:- start:14401 stop:14595 length:195 start_codon:yes stop_codon:yes gene_type:complete